MKDLFLHISDTIDDISGGPIRLVDFDLGQLEQEPLPSLSYPAVLVSFQAPNWLPLGGGVQQAEMIIQLRIAFKVYERTHSKTNVAFRDVGLAHLDTIAAIHAALNGSSGETFSPLERLSYSNTQRADLRVYTLTYTCEYYDVPAEEFAPWDEEANGELGFCVDAQLD